MVCVNLVDRTDEGIEAVKNEEMLGSVYNDKEGQAREILNLAFVIATDGDKSDIPLIDGKYVRTPYHKLTLENMSDFINSVFIAIKKAVVNDSLFIFSV